MIVCVCHNVSDSRIRRSIDAGAESFADLRQELQIGSTCGKCAGCARQILREHQPAIILSPGVQRLLNGLQLGQGAVAA
ncbi:MULTISPECIES: (2Fe-2S)-binding protein [Undibacterium]|jgi:bacterioferritin-associated ferredoxin|uniref:Bacterioferritin-associated ferredoxin n=2 Tax=Undibacterium TaxID=401469 RepID=A0A941DPH3_9BURK|nr:MULTISPECIES: (2Fe-2S)-binding protein [Undibacterium]MBR7782526.1 (2Fe-2S)-binding protein [Undibacterium luofuense]GGX46422.1 hypothetical protein GCM10010946_26220 [Undibacterium squillarum]